MLMRGPSMINYELISKINSLLLYLPYSAIKYAFTLIEWVISPELRIELRKNKELSDAHKGKRCFIIN